MKVVYTIEELRKQIKEWKKEGQQIGFVPTMGFLHEGHTSLMKCARENDKVVVSIFVNPIQFCEGEDLLQYPRDLEHDLALCEKEQVDLVFAPSDEEMYQLNFCTYVDMTQLTNELCGLSRPGHFRGVCTVVSKLFHLVTPDKAYFGEKDAQQLAVIRRMVNDLNMDLTVVGCPIIREQDGLAKSSRNVYLNTKEREAALVLNRSLNQAVRQISDGCHSSKEIIEVICNEIKKEKLAKIDYVKVVDADLIRPIDQINGHVLIAIAVLIGKTRLIDNRIIQVDMERSYEH
ncbi:MAG: pantoate--beta-alanine ligase [Clostridia bacterium]|nr:pantoate--beta-alanine ligase [Clostridia bacterium]